VGRLLTSVVSPCRPIIHLLVQTISSRKQVMIRKVVATDDQGTTACSTFADHLLSSLLFRTRWRDKRNGGICAAVLSNTADARSRPIQLKRALSSLQILRCGAPAEAYR